MKKLLTALALAAIAVTAQARISGSSHDMRTLATPGTLSACVYCHAPHNSNVGVVGAPLWNRTDTSSGITGYSSGTLRDTTVMLGANSITCLSCHDGTTDLGTMYNSGSNETLGAIATATGETWSDLGTNLRNDHPVGVDYVPGTGLATDKFATVAAVTAAGLKLYSYGGTFAAYQVECGSCHEPHNAYYDGIQGNLSYQRIDPASTVDLCTVCHSGQ